MMGLANYHNQFDRVLRDGGYDQLRNLICGPQQIAT